MNYPGANISSLVHKTVCVALVLILGAGLFATGALGGDGCGMKCCCRTGLTDMQPTADSQMRSPMGCCSGVPLSPCDLQSAEPFELPEIVLDSYRGDLPNAAGPMIVFADFHSNRQHSDGNFTFQVLDPTIKSPPIYLQKLSFLI
jgi:hypothetical protein